MRHRYALEVHYEDTDMGGIVYHANYLKFAERARSAWVRALGVDQNVMRAAGIVFVVAHMECDFAAPARFEDQLTVETEAISVSGVRLVMMQRVLRGTELIFGAKVTAACINAAGRPVRLPAQIRALRR